MTHIADETKDELNNKIDSVVKSGEETPAKTPGETPEETPEEMQERITRELLQKAFDDKCAAILAKHPKSHILTVGDKHCFLNPMNRQIIAMAKDLSKGDEVETIEMILENCWIEGDEEIKTDDDYFIPAMASVKELFNLKTSTLKKL